MKKIFLTSGLMMCAVMPAMAVPTNTSNTFPNDELMQADYTYTNQATYENTGVYSDSVDAEANYDWELVTVNAGYYLPANSTTPVQCISGYYCPGLAQQVHMDDTNAQGLTACPTGFTLSAVGATTDMHCYRFCDAVNMGTTILNYPHAALLEGIDWYGGTGNDACTLVACENGYHVDNKACAANTITINWNGATAAAISANNAGTAVYGGDIRTPQSIDPSQVPAGKRFVGWKFSKPSVSGFDLSTLDASRVGYGDDVGYQNDSTGELGADSSNALAYGLTDQTWGAAFIYGKVRGEALCSTTNTVNPDTSSTGQYCWCRATGYQAKGSSAWQNVSSSSWVFNTNMGRVFNCQYYCAEQCGTNASAGSTKYRQNLYGITQ